MLTKAQRIANVHETFDHDEIELVRMGLELAKGKLEKFKKDGEALHQDVATTKRALRLIDGGDTKPGLLGVFVQVDAVETTQVDAFHEGDQEEEEPEASEPEPTEDQTVEGEASSEECAHEDAQYEGDELVCQSCGKVIRAEPSAAEPTVPTHATIDAAKGFLSAQQSRVGVERAWDREAWDVYPSAEVENAIRYIAEHGWAQARKNAEEAFGKPATGPVAADTGTATETKAKAAPSSESEEKAEASPWDAKGEDLPRDIPFRGSLVASGLSLRELSNTPVPDFTKIKGIGAKGSRKLSMWLQAKLEEWGDPAPVDETSGVDESDAVHEEVVQAEAETDDEPTPEAEGRDAELRILTERLGNNEVVDVEGDDPGEVYMVMPRGGGYQLGFQRKGERAATFWPTKAPYFEAVEQAAEIVLELVYGFVTWSEVKKLRGLYPESPDSSSSVEKDEPRGPDVGDRVILQIPDSKAESAYIGGKTVEEHPRAMLYEKLERDERGKIVHRVNNIGSTLLTNLKSVGIEGDEWSVHINNLDLPTG